MSAKFLSAKFRKLHRKKHFPDKIMSNEKPCLHRLISERFKEALDDSGVKEEDILYIEVGHETDSNGNAGVWYVEIAECWDDEDLESDDPDDEGYGIDQTERPIKHRLSTSVGLDFISEWFRLARKTTTEAEIAAMMMP